MTSNTSQDMGLIDLLKDRHYAVQKVAQKAWEEDNGMHISDSGWSIIACISEGPQPVSHITKQLDITRQAIHKFIKALSEKGLIDISEMPNDKKKKCVALTELGKKCHRERVAMKVSIEEGIAEKLVSEKLALLNDMLRSDWGI